MNINPAALRYRLVNTKIMEWTNDDALELIEQYRSKTELWNRSDPKYKDKLCRFRAWSEIADRFGCSKAEVERKMNVLLTQYRREKHKMLMKLYQGLQPSPSKWYAFKRFDFMEITVNTGGGNGAVVGLASPGGGSSNNNNILNSGGGGVGSNSGITQNGHHHSHHNHHSQHHSQQQQQQQQQHHHQHHHNHHHAAAAVAAAAALNGLTAAGYESATAASTTTPTSSHHRRMKKEMKYFGSVGSCMGLNIPILLANSQPLEPWNPVNQFSPPPITDRNHQLRVSLPLPFSTPGDLSSSGTNNLVGGGGVGLGSGSGARSLFGGSSNSDFAGSPHHKPMDTTDDIDENNDEKTLENNRGDGRTTPSMLHDTTNDGRLSSAGNRTPGRLSEKGSAGGGGGGGGGGGSSSGGGGGGSGARGNATNGDGGGIEGGGGGISGGGNASRRSDGNSGTEAGSSPIPNTNNFEAHKQRQQLIAAAAAAGAMSSGSREQDDIDIKQELLENYFHAPHPPAPPDSHRSYSPNDDNRNGGNGGDCSDDFAQDLRVSAAAAAAAKGIDFTRFVLPPGLRRSTTDSMDEKFSPLNMRKLNPSAGASSSGQAPAHMLVGSLLSGESMSEDNNSVVSGGGGGGSGSGGGRRRSGSTMGGNQNGMNGVGGGDGGTPTASAVATAAAIYAESLNRDDCDHVGSNVSHKLRIMDRTQRIIAEKLIGEVLFYGQFNELERSARIQPK